MNGKTDMFVSCVIPMYNEEAIARESLTALAESLSRDFEEWEIVASDDGSTDSTRAAVAELCETLPNLRLTSYDDNRGKGSAVREGVLASRGDVVIYTDCDLAYGTDVLRRITDKLGEDGSDAVIGSRNLSPEGYAGYTFLRKLASRIYIKVISLAAGFRHSDSQCGIKCFCGEAARRIFSECTVNGFAFDLEVLMTAEAMGYRITEIPVTVINHRESASKVHMVRDTLKMLRDIRGIKKRLKRADFGNAGGGKHNDPS